MKITITGCRYVPKWTTLEKLIQEATNDETSRLIGIQRVDNGCNYRSLGVYHVRIRRSGGTILPVELTVTG